MPQRLHIAVFIFFLAAWTVALLVPVPKESASAVLGGESGMYFFGKCLHVAAYTLLTLLGGGINLSRPQRWLVLALMSFHGFATEFFQQFVERGASWKDVGLDHVGIALGVAFGWRWWLPRTRLRVSRDA